MVVHLVWCLKEKMAWKEKKEEEEILNSAFVGHVVGEWRSCDHMRTRVSSRPEQFLSFSDYELISKCCSVFSQFSDKV